MIELKEVGWRNGAVGQDRKDNVILFEYEGIIASARFARFDPWLPS